MTSGCEPRRVADRSGRAASRGRGIDIRTIQEALHGLHASTIDPANGLTLGAATNRAGSYRCHPDSVTH